MRSRRFRSALRDKSLLGALYFEHAAAAPMADLIAPLALVALIGAFLWFVKKKGEIFVVAIDRGRVTVRKGKVPPGFLADIREIAGGVAEATVRAVPQDGRPHIVTTGLDERAVQRLRNAWSTYPMGRS